MTTEISSTFTSIPRGLAEGSVKGFLMNNKLKPTINELKQSLKKAIERLPSNIQLINEDFEQKNIVLDFLIEQEHYDIKITISLNGDNLTLVTPKGLYKQQLETPYFFDNMEYINKNAIRGRTGNITKVNLLNEFDADTRLIYAVPVHAVEIEECTYQIVPLVYRKIEHRHISFKGVDERFDIGLFDIQGRKPYKPTDPKYKFFYGAFSKQAAESFIREQFYFGK